MNLSHFHTSNKRIKCFFFTVVVTNESLVKYYPGSLKGFMEKYYPICNQDISVRVYMAGNDVYDLIEDLIENGLKIDKDFVYFDASDLAFDIECTWRKNLDFGVGWLEGRCVNEYVYVWWTDDNQGQAGGTRKYDI